MSTERLDKCLEAVRAEVVRATGKFGPFHSAHEGYAVIKEELDELWDAIKDKNASFDDLTAEAIQVAAMGVRFLLDVCLERPRSVDA